MLDADLLRRDFAAIAKNLQRRGLSLDVEEFARLQNARRDAQQTAEELRAKRNQLARTAAGQIQSGNKFSPADTEATADMKQQLQEATTAMQETQAAMDDYLLRLPNMLHETTPDGQDESANIEVRHWGEPRQFDFKARDHIALGNSLAMMDFDAAVAMAAARFVVLSGGLARLHRALAQFMLDVHVQEHGYSEYYLPYLANAQAMLGAGQLPKFADEVFIAERDSLYLIPTAEVVLVNLVREKILNAAELPMRFVSHTPCFRREAGSYGRDTRGMLRQHQFDKVELVQIRQPADSYAALEELTSHAERILQLLELPYRVVALCGGDIGFAAAKTYDLEVWMPGQNTYREISSCSNCEAFQARRTKTRYRIDGKPAFVHTLNGSGVAIGRAMIAVIENHQQADGSVRIPPPLVPYMGGVKTISVSA
ncbi:MAG: serine--tRNA ligase [Gammaproteobacteria bacterium WSBS_2016_MAG_OTU1]